MCGLGLGLGTFGLGNFGPGNFGLETYGLEDSGVGVESCIDSILDRPQTRCVLVVYWI